MHVYTRQSNMFSASLFTVAIIATFVAVSYQLEYPTDDLNNERQQTCTQESGVDPQLVAKFVKGEIVEDEKLECYFKCRFILAGRMNEAGEMLPTAFSKTVPKYVDLAKADEIVAKCKDLKGGDPCDTAYAVAKCMKEASM